MCNKLIYANHADTCYRYLLERWSTASPKDAKQVVQSWKPKLKKSETRVMSKLRRYDVTLEQPERRVSELDKDDQTLVRLTFVTVLYIYFDNNKSFDTQAIDLKTLKLKLKETLKT